MKGLTRILMAACLCCAVGCNTDIPTEQMSDLQSSQTSCNLKLSTSQAKSVGEIVNKVSSETLSDDLKNIDFIFGSEDMSKLY